MKSMIHTRDLPELIAHMSGDMDAKRAELAELDSYTGDGDMGVTIALIFRSAARYAKSMDCTRSLGAVLGELSEVVGENAPSTFGTFTATMLQSISDYCGERMEIDAAAYAELLDAAASGVMKRGGAKLGDKTLLDALIPAGIAARAAKSSGLPTAAKSAALAAMNGAEKTASLKATKGRAGYMGERSIGSRDPGAQAIAEILASFASYAAAPEAN